MCWSNRAARTIVEKEGGEMVWVPEAEKKRAV